MGKNRLEPFSDGVFAIAATLLVLEIHVPAPGAEGGLGHALLEEWPALASYVVSFAIIGIIWVNHHSVLDQMARVDRTVLFINLLVLLWVALLPFPTNLLATYMREGGADERVAGVVYTANMTLMGFSFGWLWRYSVSRGLLGPGLSDGEIRARTRNFTIGSPLYLIAMLVALISAPACLAMNAALAVFYAVPGLGAMRAPPSQA
jgi:TMEM175 potassium channel family protein